MEHKKNDENEAITTEESGIHTLTVLGAREHNLKNIDVEMPKNKLVVITGVSGSGKSSLAFDTIYNEGQRRYMESFGTYARQFIGEMERPDVDKIIGLSPVISIEQKTTNKNPRSTVGTVTEVYDFLRLLYARIGEAYSYNTGKKMVQFSEDGIIEEIFKNFDTKTITLLAPVVRGRKGHYRELFEEIRKKGFLKVRIDGEIKELSKKMQLDRYKVHDIEVVVDRIKVNAADDKHRLVQSVQQTLQIGKGLVFIAVADQAELAQYSQTLMCIDTGISYEEPNPNSFSFNSPYGACPVCKGLGNLYSFDRDLMIPDETLSINKGGILPIGEAREATSFRQIESWAKKQKIDFDTPINKLPAHTINLILFGTTAIPRERDWLIADDDNQDIFYSLDTYLSKTSNFEGIVPILKKWYNKSSEHARSWIEKYLAEKPCSECQGSRLRKDSLWFKLDEKNIFELSSMPLEQLLNWIEVLPERLTEKQNIIAKDVLKEIIDRLKFLLDVGLHYLTLNRASRSLSGGESQRIRLASQIGSQLQGITYILDEPSIGLHQRDNHRLITALQHLRDIGNSILVVEHDKDIMLASDHLIDIGPKAGKYGGSLVAQGSPEEFLLSNSETALFLKGEKNILIPSERRVGKGKSICLKGAKGNNLKNITVDFPLGKLIVVSGVSGSGKSTLIADTLFPILYNKIYNSRKPIAPFEAIEGIENIDKVIEIDQSPIGRTPRSNPATYCGFFTDIRALFAAVPEAKIRGYQVGRFSFNVKAGRCEVCEGSGMRTIEMNFLPDVYILCEKCQGKRFNRPTLEIRYKGKSISDILEMTVDEACDFFQPVPSIYRKIKALHDVGLGYIALGQSATTFSGGEAQRVKLATELGKKDTGKTFYILDEPTTGLHFQDINILMEVLQKLVDRGNTVLIIEHNLDVIKMADHIIDLGYNGGAAGGHILFEGTPEAMIMQTPLTATAEFLKLEMQALV